MRTIDADHLRRWILSRVFKTRLTVADVIDQIDREDTIEPEIVRCKDCRHWYNAPISDGYNSCEKDALIRHENFFCAAAERKE